MFSRRISKWIYLGFWLMAVLCNLKASVSNEIGLDVDKELQQILYKTNYTINELQQITELQVENKSISDLQGIGYLVNLEILNLSNNNIRDISALKTLKNLKVLNLSGNQISSIEPLSSLSELKSLNIASNHIQEVNATSSMLKLEYLVANDNDIEDVSPVEKLKRLKFLYLQDNKIQDISVFKNLCELQCLYLWNNKIENIESLVCLKKLKQLVISNNPIEDLPCLETSGLEVLDISKCQISNLSSLSKMLELKKLIMNENPLESIEPIKCLNSLEQLQVNNCGLENISALQELNHLIVLSINDNEITDFSAILNLPLMQLYMSGNNIKDISAIKNITLGILDLSNNSIDNIESISQDWKVSRLNLANNQIRDISPLGLLEYTKMLNLSGNPITDFSPLLKMPALQELQLGNCTLTKKDIVKLALKSTLYNDDILSPFFEGEKIDQNGLNEAVHILHWINDDCKQGRQYVNNIENYPKEKKNESNESYIAQKILLGYQKIKSLSKEKNMIEFYVIQAEVARIILRNYMKFKETDIIPIYKNLEELAIHYKDNKIIRQCWVDGLESVYNFYSSSNQDQKIEFMTGEYHRLVLNYPADQVYKEAYLLSLCYTLDENFIDLFSKNNFDFARKLLKEYIAIVSKFNCDLSVRYELKALRNYIFIFNTIDLSKCVNYCDEIIEIASGYRDDFQIQEMQYEAIKYTLQGIFWDPNSCELSDKYCHEMKSLTEEYKDKKKFERLLIKVKGTLQDMCEADKNL